MSRATEQHQTGATTKTWTSSRSKPSSTTSSYRTAQSAFSLAKDDPTYRYFEMEGVEPTPCGGTHVRSTSEIGPIKIKRKSMGKQGVRLYVTCKE